jgi:hypothetical protein
MIYQQFTATVKHTTCTCVPAHHSSRQQLFCECETIARRTRFRPCNFALANLLQQIQVCWG